MPKFFKPRLDALDVRMVPATLADAVPTPPPADTLAAQSSEVEDGGSIRIDCDVIVVKGDRPTKK